MTNNIDELIERMNNARGTVDAKTFTLLGQAITALREQQEEIDRLNIKYDADILTNV